MPFSPLGQNVLLMRLLGSSRFLTPTSRSQFVGPNVSRILASPSRASRKHGKDPPGEWGEITSVIQRRAALVHFSSSLGDFHWWLRGSAQRAAKNDDVHGSDLERCRAVRRREAR